MKKHISKPSMRSFSFKYTPELFMSRLKKKKKSELWIKYSWLVQQPTYLARRSYKKNSHWHSLYCVGVLLIKADKILIKSWNS